MGCRPVEEIEGVAEMEKGALGVAVVTAVALTSLEALGEWLRLPPLGVAVAETLKGVGVSMAVAVAGAGVRVAEGKAVALPPTSAVPLAAAGGEGVVE